jgi:DnaJ family protein C protein 2
MEATVVPLPLPTLPEGWEAESNFKAIGKITKEEATQRTLEPVGPHFLAHARRARHKRTFSEDDRIQAQERAKKVEDNDDSEISEPEDAMMLQRDAKDWKVRGRRGKAALLGGGDLEPRSCWGRGCEATVVT